MTDQEYQNKGEKEAIRARDELGHDLKDDPIAFSWMSRSTCRACGKSVIFNHNLAYGSATEGPCEKQKKDA